MFVDQKYRNAEISYILSKNGFWCWQHMKKTNISFLIFVSKLFHGWTCVLKHLNSHILKETDVNGFLPSQLAFRCCSGSLSYLVLVQGWLPDDPAWQSGSLILLFLNFRDCLIITENIHIFRANLNCPWILSPLSPPIATTLVIFLVTVLREKESKSVCALLCTPCLRVWRSFLLLSKSSFFWLQECTLPCSVDVCVLPVLRVPPWVTSRVKFFSLRWNPGSRIAGSKGECTCSFRWSQILFPKGSVMQSPYSLAKKRVIASVWRCLAII